jgi:endonuclease YncB( thermonuclease family)
MDPRARLAAVSALAALALVPAATAAQIGCRLEPAEVVAVAAVKDGRTLLLADGRELRLAAVEAGEEARAGLSAILDGGGGGGDLRIERLGTDPDRYGRLVAFVFAGDDKRSVQETMLEAGLARVSARAGGRACAEPLLAAEQAARSAHRGLWADPNFAPLAADNFTLLEARRGRFALVEGKVLSVRRSGSTIYVNFGREWATTLTVTLRRGLQRSFTAAGVEPQKLQGRRIRVRGWIEQRNGPAIDVEAPEQIEFLEPDKISTSE